MNYKKFELNKIREKLQDKIYNIIYINYEKENGIKVVENNKIDKKNALSELSEEDLKDFYKIYFFNDKFMIIVYKFGDDDFRYTEIKKEDFKDPSYENLREIYMDENFSENLRINSKKLKVRVGKLKGNEDIEEIQYVEFVGGEK
ncbi:MAG: hypothetical protein HXM47_06260 [Pseudoleptotrichia goodfellowii]|nr:hypothetical protein [Pseudoleptotrichia goodfellowii]